MIIMEHVFTPLLKKKIIKKDNPVIYEFVKMNSTGIRPIVKNN